MIDESKLRQLSYFDRDIAPRLVKLEGIESLKTFQEEEFGKKIRVSNFNVGLKKLKGMFSSHRTNSQKDLAEILNLLSFVLSKPQRVATAKPAQMKIMEKAIDLTGFPTEWREISPSQFVQAKEFRQSPQKFVAYILGTHKKPSNLDKLRGKRSLERPIRVFTGNFPISYSLNSKTLQSMMSGNKFGRGWYFDMEYRTLLPIYLGIDPKTGGIKPAVALGINFPGAEELWNANQQKITKKMLAESQVRPEADVIEDFRNALEVEEPPEDIMLLPRSKLDIAVKEGLLTIFQREMLNKGHTIVTPEGAIKLDDFS